MTAQPRHVVMFSTGVGSYLAAVRVVEHCGTDGVTLRELLSADVSILRDRTGRTTKPLTMAEFRRRIETDVPFDLDDWGGCGCFTAETAGAR